MENICETKQNKIFMKTSKQTKNVPDNLKEQATQESSEDGSSAWAAPCKGRP